MATQLEGGCLFPAVTGSTLAHPDARAGGPGLRPARAADVPAIRALMESVPGFWQPHWSERTVGLAFAVLLRRRLDAPAAGPA
jgi:hypothetical protein